MNSPITPVSGPGRAIGLPGPVLASTPLRLGPVPFSVNTAIALGLDIPGKSGYTEVTRTTNARSGDMDDAKVIRYGQPISAGSMTKAEVIALAKIVAQAQAAMDELYTKYGEEPANDGAVIRFTKHFPDRTWTVTPLSANAREAFSAKTYWYAAIRINGRWWTTGVKHDGGYAWEELLAWIDENAGPGVEKVEILSHGANVTAGEIVHGAQTERHPDLRNGEPNAPEVDNATQ